jgi:flagellar protein FlaJ
MSYVGIATKFFGNFSRSVRPQFLDIKEDLLRARMTYTLEEYLSTAFFTTVLVFVVELLLLSFIFGLFLPDIILSVVLSLSLSFALSGLLFFLFYSYPSTVSKSKRSKIKKVLPFAVSYLTTLSSSKLPPITLFKTLSQFKEYGEVAEEAANITRDVELFGMNFSTAVKKQARHSPSKEFSDFLWGLNTVVTSGGDLVSYLKQKTDEFMNDYRRRITKYSQNLSLYVEIYLTLIITGSIFFIVLSSVISTLSGGIGTIAVQGFVVFVLLPMLSIGFLMLVKSVSPME